jgi:hypothetical protein
MHGCVRSISELTVLGLATDYCVKFTVLDALNLGYTVNVITDGCRGVNIQPQDSNLAFMEMAAAGATLYTLDDWLETHIKYADRHCPVGALSQPEWKSPPATRCAKTKQNQRALPASRLG